MAPLLVDESRPRARVGAIVLAGFIGFLAGELLAAAAQGLVAAATHFPGGVRRLASLASPPWWSTALGVVGLWAGFAGAIGWSRGRGRLADWPGQWRVRPLDAGFLGLGVVAQFVIDEAYKLAGVGHLNGPVNRLFGGAHGATFALMGAVTVLGSPVMEEWLFRGVLFRALAESGWSRHAALLGAVATAVLFAAAHGEARQFAGLFALGLALAGVTWRTRRVTPAVLVHVGFNATAFTALALQRAGH